MQKTGFCKKRFFAIVQKRCLAAKNAFSKNLIILLPDFFVFYKPFFTNLFFKSYCDFFDFAVNGGEELEGEGHQMANIGILPKTFLLTTTFFP